MTRSARRERPVVVHVTTTDMSLDWLLGPQLEAFGAAGYEVVGMSAAGPHVEHLARLGVRHVEVPSFTRASSVIADLRSFGQLVRLLRRLRPDIVHTHNPKPGILGRIAARLVGVPLVVNTQHGLYAQPSDRRRRRWPVYAAERIAAAFSHAELVQNPEDVGVLVDVLRVPARRVHLLGNGIDLARFTRESVSPDRVRALRAEWAIADGETVVGVVARLVAEKGIHEILEAAQILRDRGLPARLVVVGPDDDAKSDAVSAEEMSAASAAGVVFAGEHHDMPAVYAAFDMFLTASWREGVPRAAMEAAAMGLATVASDVRGNRQVVADGETGLLVPVRSAPDLANAVGRLVEDATTRDSMGRAAADRARTEFDQRTVIERTLAVYAGLVD